MKKFIFALMALCIVFSSHAFAGDFLGAPVPEGKENLKTKARLEMTSQLSHDQIIEFYKGALKDEEDIKFRNWTDSTYIEDDGARKWHSITVSKDETPTSIVIVKDNWTWIIGTLILRYIAVFVVLMVLFVGMKVSGTIISTSVKKAQAAKQKAA